MSCAKREKKRSQPPLVLATRLVVLLCSEAGGLRGQQIWGITNLALILGQIKFETPSGF